MDLFFITEEKQIFPQRGNGQYMKPIKLVIYITLLTIIAGYIYFVEIRAKADRQKAEEEKAKLVNVERVKIASITIKKQDGTTIELKRPDDIWVMTSPIQTKADIFAIDGLLTAITDAKNEKIILEKDVPWSDYGFDKPDLKLYIQGQDFQSELTFGGKNPSKSSYYLKVNNRPELFLVADTLKNSFDKSVMDLRDKTVAAISPGDVTQISYKTKKDEIELLKSSGKWVMTTPNLPNIKQNVVESDIKTITALSPTDIIDNPVIEDEKYGLLHPDQTIILRGPKTEQIIDFGKIDEGLWYRIKPSLPR